MRSGAAVRRTSAKWGARAALVALLPWLSVRGQDAPVPASDGTVIVPLDAEGGRRVAAGERAAMAEAWGDALALWLPFLEPSADAAGPEGLVPAGEGRYLPAAARVRELIAELPPAGAAAYRERAQPRAQGVWRLAVRDRDEGGIASILDRHPWTPTAASAALFLADRARDAGDPRGEIRWLLAWLETLRVVEGNCPPEGIARLREGAIRACDEDAWIRSYAFAGEVVPDPYPDALATPPGAIPAAQWARHPSLPAPAWMSEHPIAPQQERNQQYRWVEQGGTLVLVRHVNPGTHRGGRPVPAWGGDGVFVHDGQILAGRGASDGRIAWQVQAPAAYGVTPGPQVSQETISARDLVLCSLPAEAGEHNVQGGYFYRLPRQDLYALSQDRGRVAWQLGDANPDLLPLSFCAPARCVGDRVLVTGTAFSGMFGCELVCASLGDGALRWRRFLAAGQQEMSYFGRPVRESVASPAAVRGDLAVVCTNLGLVGAVDLATGAWRWAHTYPQVPLPNQGTESENIAPRLSGWLNADPVFSQDVVVAAPTDCPWLVAFDAQSGRMRWRLPRVEGDAAWTLLGGAVEGRVLVAGDGVAGAVEAATGKRLWRARTAQGSAGAWLGCLDGPLWLLPGENALSVLDVRTGRVDNVGWGRSGGPGNLATGDGSLWIATSDLLRRVPVARIGG